MFRDSSAGSIVKIRRIYARFAPSGFAVPLARRSHGHSDRAGARAIAQRFGCWFISQSASIGTADPV
jgi:hypothetical protein